MMRLYARESVENKQAPDEDTVVDNLVNFLDDYEDDGEYLQTVVIVEKLISLFGRELVADFRETYHVDLVQLVEDRRWKHIHNLIEKLDGWSRYRIAFLNSDEVVEELRETYDTMEDPSDMSDEDRRLYADRFERHPQTQAVMIVADLVSMFAGGKAFPRPDDKYSRTIRELNEQYKEQVPAQIMAMLLGGAVTKLED